jgi:hypothetical protein
LVALCAATSTPEKADLYIDDATDHALRRKYYRDFASEQRAGVMTDYAELVLKLQRLERWISNLGPAYQEKFLPETYQRDADTVGRAAAAIEALVRGDDE